MMQIHDADHPLHDWELAREGGTFHSVRVPCTVASALRDRGEWALGQAAGFDEETWIFRCRFAWVDADTLVFHGLTPNTEVWLNGVRVGSCDNMFVTIEIPVTLAKDNQLELRCLPLALANRKGRPRWRTALLDDQRRRFVRATAIGHMPSWGPTFATVGPWREVSLRKSVFSDLQIRTHLDGENGVVEIRATLPRAREGVVFFDGRHAALSGDTWASTLRVKNPDLWWPHTHGAQPLYPLALEMTGRTATNPVAFRSISLSADFELRVNGSAVFCRGACWTPSDPLSLNADPLPALHMARNAHFNMLRVSANTLYESNAFYQACDALGILVWQDFMFANLDYPFTDPSFAASARDEAQRFLLRTQTRACLAVLCGNSEVEMQPSLLGQPAVSQPFFHQVLPELTAVLRPDVPYVGSSPSQSQRIEPRRGCSHYYGVGAYQRPLRDARLSQVRFASECLGFAQRPAIASREAWHDEPWAQRIVRANSGVGDFVDVHEYYMREYFQLEPLALRSADRARYDALSEILPGEVMAATFAEWRSHGHCQGGLVWLWRDGWRSCGWGIIDADGRAKPAYHYLRRALAPHAVFLIDEGLNGLDIHVLNESDVPHQAELTIELYLGARLLDRASAMQVVAARGHTILSAEALLGRFADLPFAYRYGARPCDTVVVRWGHAAPGFHFLADIAPPPPRAIGLTAVRRGSALHVSARELARTVILECEGASDNYFHLAPGEERVITVPDAPVRVSALSATESVRTT